MTPREPHASHPMDRVERARAGDLDAFSELVGLYQDRVVAAATSWLGDPEIARDVAQEVFFNAHAALGQLDDARAFAGWLRRITRKHCDRVTRRGRLVVAPRASEEIGSSQPDPEAALAIRRAAEQLRAAVEALPERERLPVALHYLAGETQPRIAEFLELPLSTVKKRLRDARSRLRAAAQELEAIAAPDSGPEGRPTMTDTLRSLRPSSDEGFSDTVRFYLALRSGEPDPVARILDRRPELLEAEQSWEPALAKNGVLPYATRATPLITAIERGDPDMVRLLLGRGAAPDGRCGCATGESPLWAAVVLGRADLAELLLDAGADPNRRARSGNAPLHVAALRGDEEIARLLLRHGGDPELLDREGRSPARIAEQKGRMALALTLRPDERPGAMLATGIKALDLLAPLPRSGLVRVEFAAGVGMVVLLGELLQRFADVPGRAALWSGFAQKPYDPVDLRTELRESGIAGGVEVHVGSLDATPGTRREAFEAGVARACRLRDEGLHVLLVLLEESGFETDVAASLARLAAPAPQGAAGAVAGSLTTLLVTAPAASPCEGPLGPPFAARICFDRRRARKLLFPAIDPRRSASALLVGDEAAGPHTSIAGQARELLARYDEIDPLLALPDPAALGGADRDTASRAQRLLRYLSQPFLTTEPFTGRLAAPVETDALLDRVGAILRGETFDPGEDELVKRTPGPR